MINNQVLGILKRLLGASTSLSNGDESYYCPICNHHKQKLIINVDDSLPQFGSWHCWVCNKGGHGIISLCKASNKELYQEERDIIKGLFKSQSNNHVDKVKANNTYISLPKEFKSLLVPDQNNPEYRNAIHYVKKIRGLTNYDLKRYNIGYCDNGKFASRIIIPSYDENNNLNYFQARVYYENADCKKFENPTVEYNDIIGFESFINWNEPIVLCEAAFDAIAIRHNAIPGFGKNISNALNKKILEKGVKDIYLFHDPDAMKNIISYAEKYFYEGINVYIINYKSNDDASKLGYVKCAEYIKHATKINESLLLNLKIKHTI